MNFKTIPELTSLLLSSEKMESGSAIAYTPDPSGMEINHSMHKEDHHGKIIELNGLLATVTLADGRKGFLTLTLDIRDSYEMIDVREIHN